MEAENTEVFDKLVKLLTDKGIEHKITEHEPTATSEESAKVRGATLASGAKAMLLKYEASKGSFSVWAAESVVRPSSTVGREEDQLEDAEENFKDQEHEDCC
eukprot:TRINITY_DN3639_c0_g5_i1.p2 TRINITY_DN3639_c0_g5~~TRINITY_DN3639_c0_g5_i1.p2  ORF type:complete len:102 (+),score=18.89 TRINITY_DN3639_c0_g5_i1:125-430(+)